MREALRSFLAEPRVPDPPRRVWRDWALLGALAAAALLEMTLRDDVVGPPLETIAVLIVGCALLWRRTQPLRMLGLTFGVAAALSLATAFAGGEPVVLYSTGFVLLFPYALFRWGAGRQAVIGLVIMVATWLLSIVTDFTGIGDAVGGLIVLLFPAELGLAIRYQSSARQREMEEFRHRERERLARELHDTVAHYVSAIAIQAQAGRTMAPSQPQAATDALEVIEEAASRTLTEMRRMVGALRHGEQADLAPQPGVADVERLAQSTNVGPRVEVKLSGSLDDISPSVQAALFRLARESVTNAIRHAHNATRIDVCVTDEGDRVRLTVHDDGKPRRHTSHSPPGYGLVGMSERAKLLGGTLDAGPSTGSGWTVTAVLPRTKAPS